MVSSPRVPRCNLRAGHLREGIRCPVAVDKRAHRKLIPDFGALGLRDVERRSRLRDIAGRRALAVEAQAILAAIGNPGKGALAVPLAVADVRGLA